MPPPSGHELRCFCEHKPMLAIYGVDSKGRLFIHVRVYKANRLYAELYVTGGLVKIRCRDCLRLHQVLVRSATQAALEPVAESAKPVNATNP